MDQEKIFVLYSRKYGMWRDCVQNVICNYSEDESCMKNIVILLGRAVFVLFLVMCIAFHKNVTGTTFWDRVRWLTVSWVTEVWMFSLPLHPDCLRFTHQIFQVKWQVCEADHWPLSGAEVKNAWCFTSTSLYIIITANIMKILRQQQQQQLNKETAWVNE
jgi:hypothetical protein